MSIIKGELSSVETNKWGFLRIQVSGTWYGSDSKKGSAPAVAGGDMVEFDAYKNDKGYDTFKFQSLKKLATPAAVAASTAKAAPVNPKDTYWADKEAADKAKEPKIAYFAASERAIQFASLALANGAVSAFAKAKDTAKLEILTAFVDEQTQRILLASYGQKAPAIGAALAATETADVEEETANSEEGWS